LIKRVLGLTLAAMLVIGLAATGTWAYLSDSQKSSGNVFTSGKLDLVPLTTGSYSGSASLYHVTAGGNGVNGKVVFDSIAPGQNGSFEWVLRDNGSLPGTLTISYSNTFNDSGVSALKTLAIAHGATGDLAQYLMVTLQRGTGANQAAAEAAMTYILGSAGSPVALSNLAAVLNAQSQALAASGGANTVVYKLSWSLSNTDPNVNVVQADTAQLNLTFTLSQ
jgi:predicted ribosomally synthesized peptide with SipW-like signal peptide